MSDEQLFTVGKIFSPSAPINKKDLFSGRKDELISLINTINQRGQHAIIYGERGVGKTSLVNVLQGFIPKEANDYCLVKINADVSMNFNDLFRAIFSEITFGVKKQLTGFEASETTEERNLGEALGNDANPNKIRALIRDFPHHFIIIIDEFDRIENDDTRKMVADTIKNFSDYDVEATIILVGVADSVDSLISGHQSIERAIVQVKMPRMSSMELRHIIENGFKKLNLPIEEEATKKIIKLSQGLPHYTHLLSLYAAQDVIKKNGEAVTLANLDTAIKNAIEKSQESVKDYYYKATNSIHGSLYIKVLLACALAKKNEMGHFSASDVKEHLRKITGKNYQVSAFARHLNEFCDEKRGPVLKRSGNERSYQYRFINPMMETHVIMNGLASNLIWKGGF